ncbi:unnamed protein product [Cuscuta europaea]|uniref:Uncharacterized protein n=1 Tax=Cuscuta europaea TaxID=41803 RepID=A0A9P0Z684_CUSEU|nr:unnamed protein product [Cuscuta europaea]
MDQRIHERFIKLHFLWTLSAWPRQLPYLSALQAGTVCRPLYTILSKWMPVILKPFDGGVGDGNGDGEGDGEGSGDCDGGDGDGDGGGDDNGSDDELEMVAGWMCLILLWKRRNSSAPSLLLLLLLLP